MRARTHTLSHSLIFIFVVVIVFRAEENLRWGVDLAASLLTLRRVAKPHWPVGDRNRRFCRSALSTSNRILTAPFVLLGGRPNIQVEEVESHSACMGTQPELELQLLGLLFLRGGSWRDCRRPDGRRHEHTVLVDV